MNPTIPLDTQINQLHQENEALREQLEQAKAKHAKLKRFLLELKLNIDSAIDHV